MRLCTALVFLSILFGCASHQGVVPSPSAVSVPKGQSKLSISRNSDFMFIGVQARVDVNGVRVAELWRGESYAAAIQPGKVVLSTDAWSTAGRFQAHLNIDADREYVFEIGPRGEHFSTLTNFSLLGPATGVLASAIEAAVDENTGPFSINLKEIRPLVSTGLTH